ncbi:unnamed protein product [Effrenium voratum]|nr:unnamed protein product [Effrenium voratum]
MSIASESRGNWRAMAWSLRPLSGGAAQRLPETGVVQLGRHADCKVSCQDPAISGKHCRLQCEGPSVSVEDCSTNGTFVNGIRLEKGQRHALSPGDHLVLASTEGSCQFRLEGPQGCDHMEAPRKLRKLNGLLGGHDGKSGERPALGQSTPSVSKQDDLQASDVVSTAEQHDSKCPAPEQAVASQCGTTPLERRISPEAVTDKNSGVARADSLPDFDVTKAESLPDFDAEAMHAPSSCQLDEAQPQKRRRLTKSKTMVPKLSGPALLQWLMRRRLCRDGTQGTPAPERGFRPESGRRRAEVLLQDQVREVRHLASANAEDRLVPRPAACRWHLKGEALTVLSSTRLPIEPALGAQAIEAWEAVRRPTAAEAARAFTRSQVRPKAAAAAPWARHEELQEALECEAWHQQLQRRCQLEVGRRLLLRRLGAAVRCGLFEDPPLTSAEGAQRAQAAQVGQLAAAATGNEFQAATFLPKALCASLDSARPGVLGSWHPLPGSFSQNGHKDALHCLRCFRDLCLGVSGHFVGRMAREGLTERVFAGGKEHGLCGCGRWVLRSHAKAHRCDVGKPHARLKLFAERTAGLGLVAKFRHRLDSVELVLEASLESALQALLWPDLWSPLVTCSWRLTRCSTEASVWVPRLRAPCCEKVPQQSFLSSAQLVLLGWMRGREGTPGFGSRQVFREDLCETDLALELLIERDFRSARGGLILEPGPGWQIAPVLTALEDRFKRSERRGPCRVEAPGMLILVQQDTLQDWQATLPKALVIPGYQKMRALTVADVLAAEVVLAPVQLFSSEAYQRHFDLLSKPGLQVFDAPGAEPEPPEQEAPEELSCGLAVELQGLVAKAELNGRQGRLVEWQQEKGRWSVLLQKRKRQEEALVNVRPGNLKVLRKGPRPRRGRRTPGQPKVSRYYLELRAREDYMAQRQVDLDRSVLRLLRQGATAEEMPELAHGGAVLEMFRFNRLVLDDCHLLARDLVQICAAKGVEPRAQYLAKVAPLYAVLAIGAHARWGITPGFTKGEDEVAPIASLLGVQIPWGDHSEAQRFLDTWAAQMEDYFHWPESRGAADINRRRTAGSLARQAAQPRAPVLQTMPKVWAQPVMRPFSVLGTNYARYVTPTPPAPVQPAVQAIKESNTMAQKEAGLVDACKRDSMVFEIGISFVVMHYQSIFIGVMRCLFQAFRPLLILFVFGQIIKAVFFIFGAPIWMSFYSIWLFEVTYGLAQCAISFIFISFFYNNLSFARMRPALTQMVRQQKEPSHEQVL